MFWFEKCHQNGQRGNGSDDTDVRTLVGSCHQCPLPVELTHLLFGVICFGAVFLCSLNLIRLHRGVEIGFLVILCIVYAHWWPLRDECVVSYAEKHMISPEFSLGRCPGLNPSEYHLPPVLRGWTHTLSIPFIAVLLIRLGMPLRFVVPVVASLLVFAFRRTYIERYGQWRQDCYCLKLEQVVKDMH